MDAAGFGALIRGRLDEMGESPITAARRAGLPRDAIRSVFRGHPPSLGRAAEICRALDLELVIRPRAPGAGEAPAVPARPSPRPGGAPGAALEAVSDRRLAELIAAVADEYEALDPVGQASMLTRIWGLHPELRERERTARRVVAWLGWRVVESPARAAGKGG